MKINGLEVTVTAREARLLRRALSYLKDISNATRDAFRSGAIVYLPFPPTDEERMEIEQMLNVLAVMWP